MNLKSRSGKRPIPKTLRPRFKREGLPNCGECKVSAVVVKAESLGYIGVRILKGGSAVGRLLGELAPRAVLGVACSFEGALGMLECERKGIPAQFVPLLRDGCADTDVELDEVMELLEFKQP